ncbi:ABC transporter ATP-binding protein [Paenibacillus aceti]|uniref:ABC transporter ATP-binding protein n=1 Tax=Paenibacillus aceti TaxID=1820010 RepID=A0ABQ1VTQ9_9BACL|nr:ABC transporter ATP-binding protein [Paenibacillus aceti]GGF98266.1 ABC transporter ATP-binding protein [Paenibacillus aceti]
MTAATVKVEQVSKSFGRKTVLSKVDLQMEEGQIYGLIGPSGAGKTTLVKMMVGMDLPDEGRIEVLRTAMPSLSMLQQIGYMAQSDALYTELTAEENLKFFASMFKMSRREQKQRIAYAAELVHLTEELGKKVAVYSGGMKRRLSLAIALIHDPAVLILDEPTVGIDPELRQSIWKELIRLKTSERKTIIVTTHVMDEASKCDQLAMVREGRILAEGTPEQLRQQYDAADLEEVFLRAGGVTL